jgi:hypothetical protein
MKEDILGEVEKESDVRMSWRSLLQEPLSLRPLTLLPLLHAPLPQLLDQLQEPLLHSLKLGSNKS